MSSAGRSNRARAVRGFALVVRLALPRGFRREVGTELIQAFADQHRRLADATRLAVLRFWLREIGGLGLTAVREYRELITSPLGRRRRRPGRGAVRRERVMFQSLRQDVMYAMRMIIKTPVVTIVAVASLSLGIAATATIFSVANSLLLRPLPYPDADRLVMLWHQNRRDTDDWFSVPYADYFAWREQATAFDAMIAADLELVNLTGLERPEQLTMAAVTPDMFGALGATPLLGRVFHPDDGDPEDTPVVVLSEVLWRDRFAASTDALGQTITLDGVAHTVIGVMPETFDFLLGTVELWSASTFESRRGDRSTRGLTVTGRLREGVTLGQARAEMAGITARLEAEYPETNADWGVLMRRVRDEFPSETDRGLIMLLMTVVVLVLVIACVNVANLLMAKTDARQREIAVRLALGAGKRRVVRQLLTESVVLALVAGALGVALSTQAVRGLHFAIPEEIPRFFLPTFDARVLLFTLAVSIVAGLTFGITPASQALGGETMGSLVDGGRGGTASRKKKRLRSAFVVAEFALALTILAGAAVVKDLFHGRLDIDPGFDTRNLLTMEIALPQHKYDGEATVQFFDELHRRLEATPGVQAIALTSLLPRAFNVPSTTFTVDGQPVEPHEAPSTTWLVVSHDYFASMAVPLRSGRSFAPRDRQDAPPVIVVSQRFAELYFDGQDPLGARITVDGASRRIIGVVGDVAQHRLTGLLARQPAVYFPAPQRPLRLMRVVLRAQSDPQALAGPAQEAVWAVDPDQPVASVVVMDDHLAQQLAGPRVMANILTIVGLLALVLAAIGVYGVMAYTVSQQANEIGIRIALGAKPAQVVTRFTGQGARLAGLGFLLGVPAAVAVVRVIAGIVAGDDFSGQAGTVSAGPVLTVAAVLAGVGLLACYLPARRATKVDPVVVLQNQ